jgi:hypothetical protein
VAASEVSQHYKYKNMKAALANIPAGKDIGGSVSTKVSLAWCLSSTDMLSLIQVVSFLCTHVLHSEPLLETTCPGVRIPPWATDLIAPCVRVCPFRFAAVFRSALT